MRYTAFNNTDVASLGHSLVKYNTFLSLAFDDEIFVVCQPTLHKGPGLTFVFFKHSIFTLFLVQNVNITLK